jgi:hypothetical protein
LLYNVRCSDDALQVRGGEKLLTMYYTPQESSCVIAELTEEEELEIKRSLETLFTELPLVFLVDCRWPEFLCDVLNALSVQALGRFAVVDGNSKIHAPGKLDPNKISL